MNESFFVSLLNFLPGQRGPTVALAIVTPGALTLRVQGYLDISLPYSGLDISIDPEDPEKVLLRGPALEKGWIVVDDPRICNQIAAVGPAQFTTKWQSLQKSGREKKRALTVFRYGITWSFVIALMATAWLGYDTLVNAVVAKIPPKYEAELSDRFLQSGKKGAISDPVVLAAMDRISEPLVRTLQDCPYHFKITILAEDEVNAFALPGGHIVVFSGLIAESQSPDELAGVLAHEMQHVLHRHSLQRLVRQIGLQGLFAIFFGGRGEISEVLNRAAPQLMGLRFDRAQESEADLDGIRLLAAAGIPRDGMISFFERLYKKENGAVRALNFLSDHPTNLQRMKELQGLSAASLTSSKVTWDLDWEAVRAHCREAVAHSKAQRNQ